VLAVSILSHEATALPELFYTSTVVGNMASSKRMTFSLDNNICNDLVQWTSVVMVLVLAT